VPLPRQQAKLARGAKDKEHAMSQKLNTAVAAGSRQGDASIAYGRTQQRGRWAFEQRKLIRTRRKIMTNKRIDLDQHRGMAAQRATDLRRLMAEVQANERALRLRQDELESRLVAAPAANWHEAAEKARYLLNLFAATLAAEDPRRQKLIAAVLVDFERLADDC
jgi:hypothetical protein